ncbi:hypothetical protein HOY82DRAFT_596351 [Tuber indicum]|nr:hypothetical protein HOY82DRAFT_596351 [Tuber indicum]
MPTWLHESAKAWMVNEVVRWYLGGRMKFLPSNTILVNEPSIKKFVGNYAGATKTPDTALTPSIKSMHMQFPSVVLETGWRQSHRRLFADSQLWLHGSGGGVKVVILCKAFVPNRENKVKATITMCRLLHGGTTAITDWKVFPSSTSDVQNPFITVDQLFGGKPPAQLNSDAKLSLNIQRLQDLMAGPIVEMGYRPA